MIQRVPPWWFFVLFMVSRFSLARRRLSTSRDPLPELRKGHLFRARQGERI